MRGPATAESSASGMGTANFQWTRTDSAQPPGRWTIVPWFLAQRFSWPRTHHSQCPQESDCQPTPTRRPTSIPSTSLPTAATVPMTSWPGTSG